MRTIQFLTLLVTSLMASTAGSPQADRAARVDEIFKEFSPPGSPGCAVGVYQDDKIALSRAYGMANLDHDIPLTPSSIFHVASVSKQFTAAAFYDAQQHRQQDRIQAMHLWDGIQRKIPVVIRPSGSRPDPIDLATGSKWLTKCIACWGHAATEPGC
jgi:hypothetical protein